MPRIALDFDGVLYSYSTGYNQGKLVDEPVADAQDFCLWLHKSGFDIVVFSCRFVGEETSITSPTKQRTQVRAWFSNHKFPTFMYADNREQPGGRKRVELVGTKPYADLYIDDRGYRFENDFTAVKKLLQLPGNYAPWNRKPENQ